MLFWLKKLCWGVLFLRWFLLYHSSNFLNKPLQTELFSVSGGVSSREIQIQVSFSALTPLSFSLSHTYTHTHTHTHTHMCAHGRGTAFSIHMHKHINWKTLFWFNASGYLCCSQAYYAIYLEFWHDICQNLGS